MAEVERQIVNLTDASSWTRADAAKILGVSGSERAVEPLAAALKDDEPRVRAAAAKALGDLRDIRALWPLTLSAATDPDPKVRDAAAEAITWLGPEPDERIHSMFRKALLERVPQFDFEDMPFPELAQLLAQRACTSFHAKWDTDGGPDVRERKITVHARDATIAELWCRGLVATGGSLGIVIGERLEIGPVSRLTWLVQARKWGAAWRQKRQAYAARTPEGRETLRKLDTVLPKSTIERIPLSDVLTYLSDLSGAKIEADWEAIKGIGIRGDAVVGDVWLGRPPTAWRALSAALADLSGGDGKDQADFYVEGDKVIVTTRSSVEARVGKVPTTAEDAQGELPPPEGGGSP